MSNPNIKYRPDIDGLRALAVTAVVIYHAFPSLLPGGFVGVDVFFVISGFLIGTILLKSMDRGSFSFSDFYSRRIRRIFPALITVLLFCLIAGNFVLLDDEYRHLGKQIAAGSAFIANFSFWSESGYFDTAAELKPLLHLWSLAIEEQFYLLWPLLLWAGLRLRAKPLFLTVLIALISFAINLIQIESSPIAAFFLLPSRAWELLAGSLLAWIVLQSWWATEKSTLRANIENFASISGLILIAWSMFFIKASDAFPGWYAVAPVLGSVLLISAGPKAPLNRILFSNKAAVLIGLISFPIYLWHWPLLSFARIIEGDIPAAEIRATAAALSILLAWLTYKLIEKPLRKAESSRPLVAVLLSTIAVIGSIGLYIFISNNNSHQDELKSALSEAKSNCDKVFPKWSKITDNPCRMQRKSENTVALIGDSHAGHLYLGLSEMMSNDNGVAVFPASCAAPFINIATAQKDTRAREVRKDAYKLINSAYEYILNDSKIKLVILAHSPRCSYNDAADKENPSEVSYIKALESGMRRTLKKLTESGKTIIIVFDNPYLPHDPQLCETRPFRLTNKQDKCSFLRSDFEKMIQFSAYRSLTEKVLKDFKEVRTVDLSSALCDQMSCFIAKDGTVLYKDRGHLNDSGSRFVAPAIMRAAQ
ncbi:acyltransferase family protein [Ectopseudomonas mendocina]|uniref:Acyltransferase family protein n=1 Tax=Ectopseudomonas mendocina TaxID=300 RepID=A0ABZ2RD95_ECTME